MRICINYDRAIEYASAVAAWMRIRAGTYKDKSIRFEASCMENCMKTMHKCFRNPG